MNIADISAVVTGGASGLGLATSKLLLERGASVVMADRDGATGTAAASDLGAKATFVEADVTLPDGLDAAFDAAENSGPVRALVHCAGRGGDRLRILDKQGQPNSLDAFRQMLELNLVGTYNALRIAASRMQANQPLDGDRGMCVLTASAAAFDGQIGQTSYAASKAGVHGLTLVAARDLASKQIRVCTVAPGLFDTPMLSRLREDIREDLAATVPHPKRLGTAEDYAHLAVSLIENRYMNGETVRLDGGIRMAAR